MKNLSIILVALSLLSVNCTKETTDIRDSVVGNYTGVAQVKIQYSSLSNQYSDSLYNYAASVTIDKDVNVSDGLVIDDSGDKYQCNGVTAASNGIGFNIPNQVIATSSGNVTIVGYSSYTIGSMKFDGGYNSSTKVFVYGVQGNIKVIVKGYSYTVPYIAYNTLNKK